VPCVPYVRRMVPYGSPLRRVGAMWEPELAVWEPHVPSGSHIRAMYGYGRWMTPLGGNMHILGAIWDPFALYRSQMAPFERQTVLYGAPMHRMGASCTIWEPRAPYGSLMHHMWAIWEPCVHYGMQRAPCGSCVQAMGAAFSGLHHTGATCAVWEPHTPYGSRYNICEEDGIIWGQNATHGGHVEAECAGWELHVPYWR
jgi:hypothetical protein